uniref:Odorant receptor n=1 Tax=Yemma signatus TaxID=300820 RepID=A0A385H6M9_9HEMI|nr:odorant receptor [Yemma signatus]
MFERLVKGFLDFCETDDIVDNIMRKDYFYSPFVSGLYVNLKEGYRIMSIALLVSNVGISMFHMFVFLRTTLIVAKYNFTLMTFLFQLFMIMQFTVTVLAVATLRRQDFRRTHREMLGEFFDYTGEDHTELLRVLRAEEWAEKKRLLLLPVFLCVIGANCMLLAPILDNRYGDFRFDRHESGFFTDVPIPLAYPWEIRDNERTFYFVFLTGLQLATAFFICSLIGSATLACINVISTLNLHIKYLIRNIEDIEGRAERLFASLYFGKPGSADRNFTDPRYLSCYKICLNKVFSHHQKILFWKGLIQSVFSVPIGSAYSTGTLVIALSLLSINTGTSLPGTALTSTMMCILEVCIMALISVLGQRTTDLNEDLRRSIYNIRWYSCNGPIKSDISILQEVSLRPIVLKGFGLVACSLDTFSNVMNSAYSYFNVINAF